MRLLLMRHGQTHSNVSGALDTGTPGADLTDLGRTQANAAATVLADRGIEAIYCSTLVRTQQTAAPLAERLGRAPTIAPDLREIPAGDLEMRTDEESALAYRHVIARWLIDRELDVRLPGGENAHEFLDRFDTVVGAIRAADPRSALIVSHGAAIRTWVGLRVAAADAGHWRDRATEPLLNTGCIELEYDGSWQIVDWHNHPLGGDLLDDTTAPDPTGEPPA